MGATIPNKEAARSAAMSSIDKLEARFASNVAALVHEVHTFITSKTPVNTGQAVRNMVWERGDGQTQVYDAIGVGDPGPTNSMALGTEPRRAANESAAVSSISSLNLGNPFGVFTLQNNSPDIVGLETGTYPYAPLVQRSPNGMFGLAQKFFQSKLAAKGILS